MRDPSSKNVATAAACTAEWHRCRLAEESDKNLGTLEFIYIFMSNSICFVNDPFTYDQKTNISLLIITHQLYM